MPEPAKKKTHERTRKVELSVVGMQYRITKPTRRMMKQHLPFKVDLVREPDNLHDENAIKVVIAKHFNNPYAKMQIGYVRRQVAQAWAPALDSEAGTFRIVEAWVTQIDEDEGIAEMLVTVAGLTKSLMVGP